ncbi:hypothetical protein DSECCO2_562520 [anaerobic digester metagenome]
MTGRGRHILRRGPGRERVHQALRPEDNTVTVHRDVFAHALHGEGPELGDIDPETLRGHLQEPAARTGADPAHRECSRDTVDHADRLVVHTADIDDGRGSPLVAGKVDGALRVHRQLLLDQVCSEVFPDQEPPVASGPNCLDILTGKARHLQGLGNGTLRALDHLGRREPAGSDDLVLLHHDRLRGARPRVDAHRDPGLLLAGKERSPPGDSGQGLHPREKSSGGRPLGEGVTYHRQLRVFGDISPEFVPDNRRLGAPEAGADEDPVRLHLPFHQGHAPGDHQF